MICKGKTVWCQPNRRSGTRIPQAVVLIQLHGGINKNGRRIGHQYAQVTLIAHGRTVHAFCPYRSGDSWGCGDCCIQQFALQPGTKP
tara:strand:- start:10092 stop:10352 length:261 start_codon:yes stop_codon:yes gene_type:complete